MRHGGNTLIEALEAHAVRRVFTVPGESFLAALDALRDSSAIETVVCRHEGGASMMAEATGKLTGQAGVAFVTRAPGAANAISGVYVAYEDQTPLLLFVGLPPLRREARAAFQAIGLEQLFGAITKWTVIVRDTARIPEIVARAFQIAQSGRPGPVVIGLPEDVLSGANHGERAPPVRLPSQAPAQRDMAEIESRLGSAQRPLVIVGGPSWTAATKVAVEAFGLRYDIPIAAAFRCHDYVDNRHRCYAGHLGIAANPELRSAARQADLVLVIGAHLGEITTQGFSLFDGSDPGQHIIRVHPDPASTPSAGHTITAATYEFAKLLASLEPPLEKPWHAWRRDLRSNYEAFRQPLPSPGTVHFGEIMHTLSETLGERAIVTSGAGNYSQFLHRHFQFKSYPSCVAPHSGSMGYGLPAAIAAKLAFPDRAVVNVSGDGCLQMTVQELATAEQYGLSIITLVANNGTFGTIRMHQEARHPGRVFATSLINPDFAALAQSYGATGETIRTTAEFLPALQRALAAPGSTLLDLKLDPEAITPAQTLSDIRAAAQRP